jgi:hypothetical protein
MTNLLAWDFELPNVVEALDDANLTELDQDKIDSHVDLLERVYIVHAAMSGIGAVLGTVMLFLTLNRVWEIKRGVKQSGKRNRNPTPDDTVLPENVKQLLIFNFFGVLSSGCALLTYVGLLDATTSLGCDLMWKLNVVFYIIMMHSSYWILLARARAVLDTAFFGGQHKTKKLLWLVRQAAYTFYLAYPLPVSAQSILLTDALLATQIQC